MSPARLLEITQEACRAFETSSEPLEEIIQRAAEKTSRETLIAIKQAIGILESLTKSYEKSTEKNQKYPGIDPNESAFWRGNAHAYKRVLQILNGWLAKDE